MDNTGQNSHLPPEGVNAAANLFALIVESELKGNSISSNYVAFSVACFASIQLINRLTTRSDVIVASASAFTDESESEYLQASITGMLLCCLNGVLRFLCYRLPRFHGHQSCFCSYHHCFDNGFIFFAGMDERLSSYGLIARAAIDVTIPLLTRLFSERFARLHEVLFCFL